MGKVGLPARLALSGVIAACVVGGGARAATAQISIFGSSADLNLKIEPLEAAISGVDPLGNRVGFAPIRNISQLREPLDQRVMAGFGGVAADKGLQRVGEHVARQPAQISIQPLDGEAFAAKQRIRNGDDWE